MSTPPSEELRAYIQERIAAIKQGGPGHLSEDGSALLVEGGPGYCGFVSPDGDVFAENYLNYTRIERSRHTQIAVLVLGARHHPILAQLLPNRDQCAATCEICSGQGFVKLENGKAKMKPEIICQHCSGLGWVSSAAFHDP